MNTQLPRYGNDRALGAEWAPLILAFSPLERSQLGDIRVEHRSETQHRIVESSRERHTAAMVAASPARVVAVELHLEPVVG